MMTFKRFPGRQPARKEYYADNANRLHLANRSMDKNVRDRVGGADIPLDKEIIV